MPSEIAKKGLKDGLLTQKQYDKLPEKLLEGIVKSKRKKGGGKPKKAVAKKKVATKKGKKGTKTNM
tara:strand:- start:903 stop:1100 length:198 start_codon:yes stop_codon:yes gene_type:complete